MASTKKMTIMTVLFAILMSWTITTKAQDISGETTCIQALIPCAPYLGFSNPPPVCCDPLKMAIQTQLPCLCTVIHDPNLANMFNMTQVLQLPLDCGIKDVGPSLCTTGTPSSESSSAPAPLESTSTPPSVTPASAPSASTSSNCFKTPPSPPLGNASSRNIALAGRPISSMMLLLTVLIFY